MSENDKWLHKAPIWQWYAGSMILEKKKKNSLKGHKITDHKKQRLIN